MQFGITPRPMSNSLRFNKGISGIRQLMAYVFPIALIGFILLFPDNTSAHGRAVSLEYLIERSDLVMSGTVVGKAMSRESILMDTRSSDGKGNSIKTTETWNEILTDYEIEVISVIRGSFGKSTIHLTVEGGVVDGRGLSTSGTFYLTEGEKYYFFLLYEQRNDKWWAVAGQQGVFREVENNRESYFGSINGYSVLGLDGKFISDNETPNKLKLKTEQFIARISTWRHE